MLPLLRGGSKPTPTREPNDERQRPDLRNRDRDHRPRQRRAERRPADRAVQARNPSPLSARRLEGRGRRFDQQRPRRTQVRNRQPGPPGRRRLEPSGRGSPDARSEGAQSQRELRGPRPRRLEARMVERRLGPLGHDRRLRREGPVRDHRQQAARTRHVLRRRAEVRRRKARQGPTRAGPLPRVEPDQPRPRNEGHGRVPRLLRHAQGGEGRRLGPGLLGSSRASIGREAHAELEPKASERRLEEEGRGRERGRALDGLSRLGAGYARIHGGRQFGWLGDAIPQTEIKKEFRRLAKKYDAQV